MHAAHRLRVGLLSVVCLGQDPTDAQSVLLEIEVDPVDADDRRRLHLDFTETTNGLTTLTLELDSTFAVSNVTSGGVAATFTRPTTRS